MKSRFFDLANEVAQNERDAYLTVRQNADGTVTVRFRGRTATLDPSALQRGV